MSRNTRIVRAAAERVWDVLTDGWLYPSWVVGATRMRGVDDDWPKVGSRLHHSFGVWPLVIDDNTEVLEVEEPRRLVLKARGWPLGEARVVLELQPHDEGRATEVMIDETVVSGPGRLVPDPAETVLIGWRNVEALRRLAFLAEGR